jgi:alkylation response protein AidB-like acyl-CoA dehydrogenase
MASTRVIFPLVDTVGPAAAALPAAQVQVIADVVAARAADTDVHGVPRATIDALAAAGLLGAPLPGAQQRELAELIAGSDATTWFCWVQHQSPMRTLEGAAAGLIEPAPQALQDDLLPGLRSGHLLGAVAFAHVRRPGPPNPVATRVDGGWRVDGTLDWVTSWDIADVVMVMAQGAALDDGLLVCGFLPAGQSADVTPGVEVGEPLDLLAMSGTHTRPLSLDGVHLPDARVGAVLDREAWLAVDAVRTSDANPASFGVARGAIAELDLLVQERGDAGLADLVAALAEQVRHVRAEAYAAADAEAPVRERLALRARALDITVQATTAVITARAGAAMRRGESAERRVREAMFLLVQAQTRATRAASLGLLADRARSGPDVA